MEAYRQEIVLSAVAIYMAFCVIVGLWAMRRTHSASDFFIAGRGLGPMVIGLAIFSSTLSGFGFVGGPGLVYANGVSSFWMVVVSASGYALGFFLVAKRIRMMAELRNCITLPDVVAARYNSEAVRFLIALTIVLGVLGYLATQILSMAQVMQAILSGTEMLADIHLVTCVVISSAVLIFYCVTGGIIASVYTDLVQGAIMMIAGALILFTAMSVFDGGLAEANAIIVADNGETAMPFGALGIVTCLGWFFLSGLGLAGQPHLVTKMMMNRSINDNRSILPISIIGYVMAALLWISFGVVMRALVVNGDLPPLDQVDQAAPTFLQVYASPILAGVVFAGLFAAIMSTSDAFLNVGTAAIIHDMFKAVRGYGVKEELKWARIVTILLAGGSAGFAIFSHYVSGELVALLGAFGWATFAAAIFPVLAIGLNWKGATKEGAIVAIVASLVINFAMQLLSIRLPYGLDGGFLSFVCSMILFIVISLLSKPRPIAKDVDRLMEI